MNRRIGVFVVACAVLALPAVSAARTKTVYAGGPAPFQNSMLKKYGAGVDNFLVNTVTINAGDTVVWNGKSRFGGFHTVDIPAKGGSDLPLFTPSGGMVTGVNDFAGNPFWFNGKVPALGLNGALLSATGGTTYTGAKRIDSGLPLSPKPVDFKVKFAKPGVYKYFCDVHPGMIGYVVVRKKGKEIPSARDDARTLAKAEAAYVKTAKKVVKTTVTGNNVSVGASGPGGLEVFAMFPGKLTVKAGTTVTFAMSKLSREAHTATFGPFGPTGPGPYLTALSNSFSGPAPAPNAVYPSDPPGTITLTSTSHGNGFANSGAMDRDSTTPLPASGKITFTQPGTYTFMCLIHPFMRGTIVVQ